MSFGKKLKSIRQREELSQEEMIKRLNVSQSKYSRYERDKKEVTEKDDFVKRVAEEFNVEIKWLVAEDGNQVKPEENNTEIKANNSRQKEKTNIPLKDFMHLYFNQQSQMLQMILNKLGDAK
ncbi:MAG TPA: helix-turn-helix transcriptional regulator [Ferruginibacter sp.]|jgi:transcriptional regulator with XRE-family HTH domain|nr:helix-turn-helix transcriptional regulator [Ferruginibacter sp.]HPH91529.1 helix-turn-helix transcriptional regulator [Ferruginibacter sp.]